MKKVKLDVSVENLTCANCALKIENEINTLEGVDLARINIASESLRLVVDEDKAQTILQQAQVIADRIEPGTRFHMDKKSKKEESFFSLELMTLVGSLICFVLGILLKQPLLFVSSYLLSGLEVIITAIKNILRGFIFDESFLMTVATVGAFLIGEPLEAAAVMLFYNVGEVLQQQALRSSKKNIMALLDHQQVVIHLKKDHKIIDVNPEDVKVGDVVEIRVGEKVAIDGIVKQGCSALDTKAITGESMPVTVEEGTSILSGSINLLGVIDVQCQQTYQNSMATKLVEQIKEASDRRSQTEQMITRIAKIYTPIVVGIAAIMAFIFPFVFPFVSQSAWLYRSLIFLVASCPCALVLSVPLSYFAGIGQASKQGILVKSAQVFDEVQQLKGIYFDKTGTLTMGQLKVVKIEGDQKKTLEIAASLEAKSNHPLAIAIREMTDQTLETSMIKEVVGQGLIGMIEGQLYFVGNDKLMKENGIAIAESQGGYSTIYVASEKTWIGTIYLADQLRPETKDVINHLRAKGYRVCLLTGDQKSSTEIIEREIELDEIHTSLLPNDKMELLREHSMFVGDGINDGLVLLSANIGVAMGGLGSDLAIEAADVVVMNDQLTKIPEFIRLSKRVHQIVLQNIILVLLVKIVVLLLGSLGLADMILGVFADVGVSILAVLNAMRIFRK